MTAKEMVGECDPCSPAFFFYREPFMQFILDENTKRLRIKMTEAEEQRLKADADKRGMSVQEMLQADLDAHAAKMFPGIVTPRR
jgi:hypothetical protein